MTTTLITGASSGIGEAFARRLAAEKHDLFLVARTEDKLRTLCEELSLKHGVTADHFSIDLSEAGSDLRLFEETQRLGLSVDWLINNAGFGSMGDFVQLDVDRELEMVRLNIEALVALTHRYLRGMRDREHGLIINVSSTAGEQPIPFMATYAATKAFVTSFSEATAEENRPFGVQVMALCPGSTETNFFQAGNINTSFAFKGQQTPEEVVDAALAAVGTKRVKVVSGWVNWIVASASAAVPNSLITRAIAKKLHTIYQKQK